jgi:hypothetical protein
MWLVQVLMEHFVKFPTIKTYFNQQLKEQLEEHSRGTARGLEKADPS